MANGHAVWKGFGYSWIDAAVRAAYTGAFALLCFFAAIWMAQDVFPAWVLSDRAIKWLCGMAFFTAALYEMGISLLPRFRIAAGLLVPAVYARVFYAFGKPRQIDIEDGACALATEFLIQFNKYMRRSYWIWTGKPEMSGLALAFWSAVILAALLILALLTRKRLFLLFLPLTVLLVELSIGHAPGIRGMRLFFIGILFAGAGGLGRQRGIRRTLLRPAVAAHGQQPGRQWYIGWMPVACLAFGAALMLYAGSRALDASKGQIMALAPRVRQIQRDTEQKLSDFVRYQFGRTQKSVSNRAPRYTGKEMMEVTASLMPVSDIFLRGFCGTDYEDGSWVYRPEAFKESCAAQGITQEEAARELMQRQYALFESGQLGTGILASVWNQNGYEADFTIRYTGLKGREAYAPYTINLQNGLEDKRLIGDALLQKANGQESAVFHVWNDSISLKTMIWMQVYSGSGVFGWYDQFAGQAYMDVGQSSWIQQYLQGVEDDLWLLYGLQGDLYASNATDGTDVSERNLERLVTCAYIKDYLKSRLSYSLNLDTLPAGEDPVKYFLMQGQKGYCVHFASAAVLLFRAMGIPARYMSGYVIRPNEFKPDGDVYRASVKDSAAHAWAEVYLEQIGWIPVDVTPGTAAEMGEAGSLGQQGGGQAGADKGQEDSSQPDIEKDSAQAGDEAQAEKEDGDKEKDKDKQKDGVAGKGDRKGFYYTIGKWKMDFTAVSLIFVLGIGAFLGGCFLARVGMRRYHRLPWREIEAGRYQDSVRRVNRRICRLLCMRTHMPMKHMTDAQYGEALIQAYPQIGEDGWGRFMQAVQAAAFSQSGPKEAEARFCYEAYCKIYKKTRNMKGKG